MRTLLALALFSSFACTSGAQFTLRFTGPAGADHVAAAKVLKTRLESFGKPADPIIDGDSIIVVGRFKVMDGFVAGLLGRPGQLGFHVVEDEAAAKMTVQGGGALVTGGHEGLHISLCADDEATLKRSMAKTLAPGKVWLREAGKKCALLLSPAKLTERDVEDASAIVAQDSPPEVQLDFTDTGSEVFAALTRQLKGRRLAIVLDGEVLAAPVMMDEIAGGTARISLGRAERFETQRTEAQMLARSLKGERLPARYAGEIVSVAK